MQSMCGIYTEYVRRYAEFTQSLRRPPRRKNRARSEPAWSRKECLPKPHIVFALCKGLYCPGGVHASLCALHHRGAHFTLPASSPACATTPPSCPSGSAACPPRPQPARGCAPDPRRSPHRAPAPSPGPGSSPTPRWCWCSGRRSCHSGPCR